MRSSRFSKVKSADEYTYPYDPYADRYIYGYSGGVGHVSTLQSDSDEPEVFKFIGFIKLKERDDHSS